MVAKVENIVKIKRRYPKEWLLLTNVVADELTQPVRGKLVAHSKNRDDIYAHLKQVHGKIAIEYAGDIPKDLFVVFSWALTFLKHCRLAVDFKRGLLPLES